MTDERRQTDPREYLYILRRRKWLLIGSFCLIVGLVAVFTWLQTPIFKAEALLLARTTRTTTRWGEELPAVAELLGTTARSVETQKQLLETRPLLEKTIEKLNLRDITPEVLRKKIEIETIRDTDVISVSVYDPDPALARDIANTLVDEYVKLTEEFSREAAQSAEKFIKDQLEVVSKELAQAELELEKFKKTHDVIDVDEESRARIEELAKLEGLAAQTSAELKPARVRAEILENALREQSPVVVSSTIIERNPILEQLEAQLQTLEAQRAGKLVQYTENHQVIRDLDAQIAKLRQEIDNQLQTIVRSEERALNELHQQLIRDWSQALAEAKALQARSFALHAEIAKRQRELSKLPTLERQLARLERNAAVSANIYTMLREKYEEVRVQKSMSLAQAHVVSPAVLPEKPVKPRKMLNLALAIVMGLLVGLGFVALAETLDDTIRSPEDVETRLNLPVLAVISRVRERPHILISELGPRSPITEAYRALRTNLRFAALDLERRSFLVTSAGSEEGKTTTVCNLAVAMAQAGQKVLLVDSDLRKPHIHRMFGLANDPGLTNIIAGDVRLDDCLQETDVENLTILASGPLPPNPSELLDSERMDRLMREMESGFDAVLFDSPPALVVTDATVLAAKVGGVILVLDMGGVSRKAAERTCEILRRAKARLLGACLNKVELAREAYYYTYYYYYYSYYGGEEGEARKQQTEQS